MTVFSIKFEDFKNMAENRRIYVFEGSDFFDFHYIFDNVIVKSTVMKKDISNVQTFFSDRLFYGFVRLEFRIPNEESNLSEFVPNKKEVNPITDIVQPVELVNEDIQREGVDE